MTEEKEDFPDIDTVEDEKEEQREEDSELMEDLREDELIGYGSPQAEAVYERFKFLTEVRDNAETIKSSFLTKSELGTPLFSVRFWITQELKARAAGMDLLGDFLHLKAIGTTDTGLSREGFLINSAITKRKESHRAHRTKLIQEEEK